MITIPPVAIEYSELLRRDPVGRYPEMREQAFEAMMPVVDNLEALDSIDSSRLCFVANDYGFQVPHELVGDTARNVRFFYEQVMELTDRPLLRGFEWIGGMWLRVEVVNFKHPTFSLGSGIVYFAVDGIIPT